jgi:hypothetical protein
MNINIEIRPARVHSVVMFWVSIFPVIEKRIPYVINC